jgi:hypothetical protein
MEVKELRAKSDSQPVTSHFSGELKTKNPQLLKYLKRVHSLAAQFSFILIDIVKFISRLVIKTRQYQEKPYVFELYHKKCVFELLRHQSD